MIYIFEEVGSVTEWTAPMTMVVLAVSSIATHIASVLSLSIPETAEHYGALILKNDAGTLHGDEAQNPPYYNTFDCLCCIPLGVVIAIIIWVLGRILLRIEFLRMNRKGIFKLRPVILVEAFLVVFIVGTLMAGVPGSMSCKKEPMVDGKRIIKCTVFEFGSYGSWKLCSMWNVSRFISIYSHVSSCSCINCRSNI